VPCDKGGPDNGWWLGFDCAHSMDAQDPSLPSEHKMPTFGRQQKQGGPNDQATESARHQAAQE
jgi:hypothetical protein